MTVNTKISLAVQSRLVHIIHSSLSLGPRLVPQNSKRATRLDNPVTRHNECAALIASMQLDRKSIQNRPQDDQKKTTGLNAPVVANATSQTLVTLLIGNLAGAFYGTNHNSIEFCHVNTPPFLRSLHTV